MSNVIYIELFGERVKLVDAARKYGLRRLCLQRRIESGMAPEAAILKPSRKTGVRKQVIRIYDENLTCKEAAKKYGLNVNTLTARIARGMTPEDAVSSKLYPSNSRDGILCRKHLCFGERLSALEMSKKYGVHIATLRARMIRGASPEEAVTQRRTVGKKWLVFEEELTVSEIAKRYDLAESLIRFRLSAGMIPEEAVTKENRRGRTTATEEVSSFSA